MTKSTTTLRALMAFVAISAAVTLVDFRHANAESTTTGTAVSVSQLFSGCYRTSNGLLTCLEGSYWSTEIVQPGPLSGKTVIDFEGIRAGTFCSVTSDGAAYCWGNNSNAAVGDNTVVYRTTPTAVVTSGALIGVQLTRISTRDWGTCAISTISKMFCWGRQGGSSNYLKVGSPDQFIPPTQVSDISLNSFSWRDVQVSGSSYSGAVCGLSTSDHIKCWRTGSINGGSSVFDVSHPALAQGETLNTIESVGTASTGCVLSSIGSVYCWGSNTAFDRLPSISTTNAQKIPFTRPAVDITVEFDNVCASLSNGQVECMGSRYSDYVSLGTMGHPIVSIAGTGPDGVVVTSIEIAESSTLYLSNNGQLWKGVSSSSPTSIATVGQNVSPKTPNLSVSYVELTRNFESGNCEASRSELDACVSLSVGSSTSTKYSVTVFGDSAGRTIVTRSDDLSVTNSTLIVDGRRSYWVQIVAENSYGRTTSPMTPISRIYTEPSISITSSYAPSGTKYLYLDFDWDYENGGMSYETSIQFRRKGSSQWLEYSVSSSSRVKTSSIYEIVANITTPLGTASDSSTIETPNLVRKTYLYKNRKVPLSSVFRIDSPGKRTWSRVSGCRISGNFLVTTSSRICKFSLKVARSKGYEGSTWTYSTSVY